MQKRQRCQHTLRSHTQCTSDLQPSTALVCGVTPPDVVFVFIKMAKPALLLQSPGDVSGSYFSFVCKSKTLHFYYHWGIKPKLQIYNSYIIIIWLLLNLKVLKKVTLPTCIMELTHLPPCYYDNDDMWSFMFVLIKLFVLFVRVIYCVCCAVFVFYGIMLEKVAEVANTWLHSDLNLTNQLFDFAHQDASAWRGELFCFWVSWHNKHRIEKGKMKKNSLHDRNLKLVHPLSFSRKHRMKLF